MGVQSVLPEWAQWIQAIGPLITAAATVGIGFIVAFIAWRQHRTAHEKLVLDLFEKRLAVHERVNEQLRKLVEPGNLVSMNISQELQRIMSHAKFLFGDEAIQKLKALQRGIPSAHLAYSSFYGNDSHLSNEERDEILERHTQRLNDWHKACLPYMRMTQKL